jgi:hypothetical protein
LLQGFHAVVAMTRAEPHWMLTDDDAKRYGTALSNALRHMPIQAAQKSIDYATLVIVAFAMEAPRVGRSVQIARAKGQAPQRGPFQGGAQVFQFHPNPSQSQPPPAATSAGPVAPPAMEGVIADPPYDEGA